MVLVLVLCLTAAFLAASFIAARSLGRGAAPRPSVQVTLNGFKLSADARGTDASATIDNLAAMPVDVTIRVRGFDAGDRLAVEQTLGPYRNLRPGGFRVIKTYFDMTPLKTVTFEAIAVDPVAPDRP